MAMDNAQLKALIDDIKNLQKLWEGATDASVKTEKFEEMSRLLKEANKAAADLGSTMDCEQCKNLNALNKTNTAMAKIFLVNKGIVKTFADMGKETAKFTHSTGQWFIKGQELAKEYLTVSKNIGLSSKGTAVLTDNFNSAVRESMRLGYSLEEMRETFSTFAEETGRARILSDDEAENIAKISQGANLYASEATKLAESFDLMGVSSERTLGFINQTIGIAQKTGLNANKIIKVLSDNMKTMQNYSFAKGVKGMTAMASQAVKMRADVGEMLQMADKFYQPEAAIEAAANLQMLGGDIAKAFGDPFETMYLARNKPEELAERVAKMTENMMSFNKETGEFEMPAEVRMQLQAVSKELGMSESSMVTMARQASKIRHIKMDVSGNIQDEDIREGIAGMARMKDGKWVVDFTDKTGTVTKPITQLTDKMAKDILSREDDKKGKSEKDFLSEIAINTQVFEERMKNIQESQQYGFVAETDVYTATMEGFLKNTMNNWEVRSNKLFESLNTAVGSMGGGKPGQGMKEIMREAFGVTVGADGKQESIIDEFIATTLVGLNSAITNAYDGGEFKIEKMTAAATNVLINTTGIPGFNDVRVNKGGTLVAGTKGSFTLSPEDQYVGSDGGMVAGSDLFKKIKSVSGEVSGYSEKEKTIRAHIDGTVLLVSPTGEKIPLSGDELKKVVSPMIQDALAGGRYIMEENRVEK